MLPTDYNAKLTLIKGLYCFKFIEKGKLLGLKTSKNS